MNWFLRFVLGRKYRVLVRLSARPGGVVFKTLSIRAIRRADIERIVSYRLIGECDTVEIVRIDDAEL